MIDDQLYDGEGRHKDEIMSMRIAFTHCKLIIARDMQLNLKLIHIQTSEESQSGGIISRILIQLFSDHRKIHAWSHLLFR